jgi:hypothetical protein
MSAELELVTQPMSAMDVRAQVNLIQEVMKTVMQDGTHYGKIPGAGQKPTLLKAGAEKLASTFRLAVDPIVEELSYGDEYRVRVKANIAEMGSGRFLGAGVGEASSAETKYQWRAAVCDQEYDETPDHLRRVKWNRGDRGPWQQRQVRMNVADVINTVLKMAKKRAMVDGILTVTGASDIFTQDIEELPKEYLEQRATLASVQTQPAPQQNRFVDPTPLPSTATTNNSGSTSGSAIASSPSSDPGEPDIRPRSQRTAQPPTQPPPVPPAAYQGQQTAPQGQVVDAEPVISEKQRKRMFAIQKSCNLSDQDVVDTLRHMGLTCHRDEIPKSKYNGVIDAIDPNFKFHTQDNK